MTHFVLVSVQHNKLLIRIDDVDEILPMMALSQSASPTNPQSRGDFFRGLINLRGDVIPIFDCVPQQRPLSPDQYILVSQLHDNPFGLIVDDVDKVLDLPPEHVVTRSIGAGQDEQFARLDNAVISVLKPRSITHDGGH